MSWPIRGSGSSLIVGEGTPALYGSNVCVAGDSIAQQNSNIIGLSVNTLQRGPIAWALSYLGHPWDFQPADNFAVFGSTTDAIIATQLPVLLAAHRTKKYTRCFLSNFTNDTNSGAFTLAQIKSNGMTLFNALRSVGIIPVHTGVRPRGKDVATTPAKQQNADINEWLYGLGQQGIIEYIDVTATYADNSTAFGNVLSTMVYDYATSALHPNGTGANLEGQVIAQWYQARGIAPQLKLATMQNDVFDRVNNQRGVAFGNANPLMQGGTTAPTGMTTSGGTWSKVNRTMPNGQMRSDPTCALAASTTHFLYDDFVASGNWSGTQLATGDIMEGRAKVVITGGVNITSVSLLLVTNDGTTTNLCNALGADYAPLPDGNHTLYLKVPRVAIPAYSGTGNASIFMRAIATTGATGAGTFTVQGFEPRKVA